ncbi:MAG TPA: MaoC family dehydratase N-terminal domain-containing protein [Myxococcota bacterium]
MAIESSQPAAWDAVSAGDAIPVFARTTDLANWNRFAAVNDEFIPLHMDADAARAVGQPDVFGMGNLRLSYLHNLLHAWLAGRGDIVELSCEFRGLNFKGDRLTARGRVIGKERVKTGPVIHLELGIENQRGEETTPGEATVLLFEAGGAKILPDPKPLPPPEKPAPGALLDERTLGWLGRATEPFESLPVGANDIRRWAIATHHPEPPPPEFTDLKAAERGPWGGLVAPRDFNPFAWMTQDARREPWLRGMGTTPGTRVLNGGQRSRYFAPIRPGDVITSTASLSNAYERIGKLGTMLFLVNETRWTNQDGRLVRVGNRTTIYY